MSSLEFEGWSAPAEKQELLIQAESVASLAALINDGLPIPGPGDPLPLLWHWAALAQWPISGSLDVDGHPPRGQLLPPITAPRRMLAGGTVTAGQTSLRVGQAVVLRRQVTSVRRTVGRSGPLVLVTLEQRLSDLAGKPLLTEEQQFVYLEMTNPRQELDASALIPGVGATHTASLLSEHAPGRWTFHADPVVLMRFSAATANAHRIHYDWPYATGVEGYPGLVVHGPLLAIALAETVRLGEPSTRFAQFRFRAQAPLFCGEPASLSLHREDQTVMITAAREGCSEKPLMTAEVRLG